MAYKSPLYVFSLSITGRTGGDKCAIEKFSDKGGHHLEIKINREIREYTEAMYFGLSLRQFICAVLACGVAVGLYFLLRPHMGMETVSWVCMLGAAPFAAIGFIKYHGMTAEKFLWVWIKSEILMPKYLVFHPENLYYELAKDEIRKQEKEAMGKHVKNTKNRHAAGQGEV